jgi:hypothetical protein
MYMKKERKYRGCIHVPQQDQTRSVKVSANGHDTPEPAAHDADK